MAQPIKSERGTGTPGVLRQALVLVAVAVAALLLWRLRDLLLLIFAAVLFALLLLALAELVQRLTPLSGRWPLVVSIFTVFGTLGLAAWLFGAEVRAQVEQLAELLPKAWERLQEWVSDVRWLRELDDRVGTDMDAIGGVVAGLRWAATSLMGLLALLVVIAVGGLYIAAQPELYRAGIISLCPPRLRERVSEALDACSATLRLWLLGQLMAMVAVGLLTGIGLWLIGMPSAIALGLLAGIAEFVPFFGPVLAAIPGLLVALGVGPDMLLWALAVYVVVQQIESNVITPIVQRQVVWLPPALTLFAAVAMALLFGLFGLLLATPLTVLLFVLVKKLYVADTLHEPADLPGEDKSAAAGPSSARESGDAGK